MTNTTQHGGARPKVRDDDRRRDNGGNTGTGPKPKKVTLELGAIHYTHVRAKDGNAVGPTMMLKVTKVDRECLELTDQHAGHVYHIVR